MVNCMLAVKIVYLLDMELRCFSQIVVEHKGELSEMASCNTHYTTDQLSSWLYGISTGRVPAVLLPISLGGHSIMDRMSGRQQDNWDTESTRSKAQSKQKHQKPSTSEKCQINENILPAWYLPNRKDYAMVFCGDVLNGWPIVKNKCGHHQAICIKFHAKGHCLSTCGFSHIYHTEMDNVYKQKANDKFSAMYVTA